MTSVVRYLMISCFWIGQLLPLIQGQTFSNNLPPTCNPPCALPNVVLSSPYYAKFLVAVEPYKEIDNECYTAFPIVGGDNSHFMLYQSRVYADGTNEIYSYLQHINSSGVIFLDSPQCRVLDTVFDQGPDGTYIAQRCYLGGGCNHFNTAPCNIKVFGFSSTYGRLDSRYWNDIDDILERRGYPHQRYVALPMNRLPRCVTSRVCELP